MGCKVQVHEKTDKRGTWAYHCVDGWYLATSDEHYQAHKCHIKTTKGERVSDTVQFQHKHITNPTVTPQDKIMRALAECTKAIKGIKNVDATQDLRELQWVLTDKTNTHHAANNQTEPTPEPEPSPVPRVDNSLAPASTRMITRSMVDNATNIEQSFPRVVKTDPITCSPPK